MTKLIFLDIDGVLTSVERGNSYLLGMPNKYQLDEICVSKLMKILNEVPDARVIIHSNWRKHKDNSCTINGKVFVSLMPTLIARLGDKYLSTIPHYKGNNKCGDICNYLSAAKFEDTIIAILDDSDNEELERVPYHSKFFKCDTNSGLTDFLVDRVIQFLK